MSAFVEECRREWKRLGVPELLAEEMSTDLEADLAEAQADGVSAAEILGESDPRRFAATWASERGLVPDRPPQKKSRKWLWIALAVVLAVFIALPALALIGTSSGGSAASSGHLSPANITPPRRVGIVVPNFVGLTVCKADLKAQHAGLIVHAPDGPCAAVVVKQRPHAGAVVRADTPSTTTVALRVRRPK